jgi:oligopeptide/dipeptide ABC transporter ATP-binding protein
MPELLHVEDLEVTIRTDEGDIRPVAGVSFQLRRGETLGLVGESGCGKSITALSLMGLLPPTARVSRGRIAFDGRDLLTLSEDERRRLRGSEMAMVFQEPMTSLNPVYTVGDQIAEAIRLHQGLPKSLARERAIEMLRKVGIPSPERRVDEYPHQMSGGMRQRVMIAMALSCNPKLLIADEPTTALDVTIQAQILELMKELRDEFGMAIIIITHDLGVVAEMADRVAVMYAGRIVEEGDVRTIFGRPSHPYTEGLLRSIPRLDQARGRLHVIPGTVPSPLHLPRGCRFSTRCPYYEPGTCDVDPELTPVGEGHRAACHRVGQLRGEVVSHGDTA